MASKMTAVEHLEQIVEEHPHSPGSQRVSLTLGEVRDLKAQIAMLTDTVVMAAALYFEEITDEREAGYASEVLHETAQGLVRSTPRLKGGH
jgi:hypothetical protein